MRYTLDLGLPEVLSSQVVEAVIRWVTIETPQLNAARGSGDVIEFDAPDDAAARSIEDSLRHLAFREARGNICTS